MAVTVSILSATAYSPGSYLITCTACRDGNHLGAFDSAERAYMEAGRHRCVFPKVSVNVHGDRTLSLSVTLNGARMDFTHGEAVALLSGLAQALATVNTNLHAESTAKTLDALDADRRSAPVCR